MIVVVFRARRTPEGEGEEYRRWFLRMSELARQMPGYISHKGYVADDGERLTPFEGSQPTPCMRGPPIPNTSPSSNWAARNSTRNIICRFASSCAHRNSSVTPNGIGGRVSPRRDLH